MTKRTGGQIPLAKEELIDGGPPSWMRSVGIVSRTSFTELSPALATTATPSWHDACVGDDELRAALQRLVHAHDRMRSLLSASRSVVRSARFRRQRFDNGGGRNRACRGGGGVQTPKRPAVLP